MKSVTKIEETNNIKNKKSKILDTLRVAFQKGQMKFEKMKIKYTMFTLMNIIE